MSSFTQSIITHIRKQSTAVAIVLLIIFYTIGIIGLLSPSHEQFARLTPVNLLVSLFIVLWRHPSWSERTILFLGLCYVTGFAAEWLGVHSGILFGEYEYGRVLGPKLWEVPLMIGINWMLLAYCAGVTINHLIPQAHWLIKAVAASATLVVLDLWIEPVAIEYGFWYWDNQDPPLQNYLGWFIVAFPLLLAFMILQPGIRNKAAVALLILQYLFFILLALI